MTIGERIRSIRQAKGISQTELANATGISKQTIYKYETNIILNIPSDKIEAISGYLNVNPAVIMGWEDFSDKQLHLANGIHVRKWNPKVGNPVIDREELEEFQIIWEEPGLLVYLDKDSKATPEDIASVISAYAPNGKQALSQLETHPYNPTHRIPILGRISAGLPLYAEEHIEGYTYTELNGGAEYFALRVSGDSMNAARIYDGDTLIVRRQDVVDNGEIAVVMVNGDEATVKRFYRTASGVTLMPQSTNPIHQPQIYDTRTTSIRVIGLVVKNEITF